MIFYAYLIPALWLGFLFTLWIQWGVAAALLHLPTGLVQAMSEWPLAVAMLGFALAVGGQVAMQWEVVYHRKIARDLDTVAIYSGVALILTAYLLTPEWWRWLGMGFTTVLLAAHQAVHMMRIMMTWTSTLMLSLVFLLAYVGGLVLLTILSWDLMW